MSARLTVRLGARAAIAIGAYEGPQWGRMRSSDCVVSISQSGPMSGNVQWNTVYHDRAVRQLGVQGVAVPDDLSAHIAPLGWEHIALTDDYVWSAARPEAGFRPLRDVRAAFLPQAA